MSTAEHRVAELGLEIPDYANPPYGRRYGNLRPFHRMGTLLELSGLTPEHRDGTLVHPGTVGVDITVEQGYEAARVTGLGALGMIRYALGSLDRVVAISRARRGSTAPTRSPTESAIFSTTSSAPRSAPWGAPRWARPPSRATTASNSD